MNTPDRPAPTDAGAAGAGDAGAADAGATRSGRADPRTAFRGPYSAALTLEAIIVPFSLLVMAKVEGGLSALKVAWVVVLVVGMIAAIPLFSRAWGLGFALGLQVLMLLGWIVSPSLGVLGVMFCLVWAFMLYLRQEVIRRQAAWPDA